MVMHGDAMARCLKKFLLLAHIINFVSAANPIHVGNLLLPFQTNGKNHSDPHSRMVHTRGKGMGISRRDWLVHIVFSEIKEALSPSATGVRCCNVSDLSRLGFEFLERLIP